MFHDRVAFGGSIIAIGLLYMWLAEFPLGKGEAWAWWTLVLSGALGFGSFLTYLGYGYLDTWHGVGTLALLPLFVWGLVKSRAIVKQPRSFRQALRPVFVPRWRSRAGLGRLLLLCTALGMILGTGCHGEETDGSHTGTTRNNRKTPKRVQSGSEAGLRSAMAI